MLPNNISTPKQEKSVVLVVDDTIDNIMLLNEILKDEFRIKVATNGKIGIPDQILFKPGPLNREEYEIMKTHTILGRDAIQSAENLLGGAETFLSCAREIAYCHHEKWNGTGYPQGLAGTDIPLPARLMAIVDAYDALTTDRIYNKSVSHRKAVAVIRWDCGKHFDPDIVRAFLALEQGFYEISQKYTRPGLKDIPFVNI